MFSVETLQDAGGSLLLAVSHAYPASHQGLPELHHCQNPTAAKARGFKGRIFSPIVTKPVDKLLHHAHTNILRRHQAAPSCPYVQSWVLSRNEVRGIEKYHPRLRKDIFRHIEIQK